MSMLGIFQKLVSYGRPVVVKKVKEGTPVSKFQLAADGRSWWMRLLRWK